MVRVAINGFGRIGRAFLRRALDKGVNVVAINSLGTPGDYAYLLKYDSVYGLFNQPVSFGSDFIKVGRRKILCFSNKDPWTLPWKRLGIDVVIESTGVFRNRSGAKMHLEAGARKVVISAPAERPDRTIVIGVNDSELKKEDKIISMASCTTNCLAPIAKILEDNYGIERGFMTTIHAYTNNQVLLDDHHKKKRRGRAAAINLIPTTSGATKAICEVIPSLSLKLDGLAIRAPVACGSIVDFVAYLKKSPASREELNNLFIKYSKKSMRGVLLCVEDEIVSSDIIGNSHSSIVDLKLTMAKDRLVKVLSWYDNEWGYSCRLVDLLKII